MNTVKNTLVLNSLLLAARSGPGGWTLFQRFPPPPSPPPLHWFQESTTHTSNSTRQEGGTDPNPHSHRHVGGEEGIHGLSLAFSKAVSDKEHTTAKSATSVGPVCYAKGMIGSNTISTEIISVLTRCNSIVFELI